MTHRFARVAFVLVSFIALSQGSAWAQLGSLNKDLVFTPTTPCRIFDSRAAGVGALVAGTAKAVDVTTVANYAPQGGEAGNCNGFGAAGSFAAAAINLTIINPNASGSLKAWPFGATEPPTATAMAFAAGEVRSNFHVLKLDQGAAASELSVKSSADAHLTIDVVGYFKDVQPPTMECVNSSFDVTTIAPGANGNAFAPACSAGYLATSTNCETSSWLSPLVWAGNGACSARNNSGTTAEVRAARTCCRIAP